MTTLAKRTRAVREGEAAHATPAGRVVLQGVSWEAYELLLRDLAEAHFSLTYDRGDLEIISPSFRHDRSGRLLNRLVGTYTEVRGIPIVSCGATT